MKTKNVPSCNFPKKQSLSNNIAKRAALAGLGCSSIYLGKNFDDIFAKNIRNVNKMTVEYVAERFPNSAKEMGADKLLASIVKKTKIKTVAIPAIATAVVTAGAALVGKTIGVIAEKIQQKKELDKIGKMIDENAQKAIADLEKPIDYPKLNQNIIDSAEIEAIIADAEKDLNPAFKGADFEMPIYTDSAPDIATMKFIRDFDNVHPVPTSKVKSESRTCHCGKNHEELYSVFTDSPKFEIYPQDFIELYDKPTRAKLSN